MPAKIVSGESDDACAHSPFRAGLLSVELREIVLASSQNAVVPLRANRPPNRIIAKDRVKRTRRQHVGIKVQDVIVIEYVWNELFGLGAEMNNTGGIIRHEMIAATYYRRVADTGNVAVEAVPAQRKSEHPGHAPMTFAYGYREN